MLLIFTPVDIADGRLRLCGRLTCTYSSQLSNLNYSFCWILLTRPSYIVGVMSLFERQGAIGNMESLLLKMHLFEAKFYYLMFSSTVCV